MHYYAILHEKSRRNALFFEPDLNSALNCGRASENSPKVVKYCCASSDSFSDLIQEIEEKFQPYLNDTEVIKIYDSSGCELRRITCDLIGKF